MSLREAIRNWEFEVDDEAERLIKRGVPPYDAIEKAKQIVSQRREQAAERQPLPKETK